MVLIPKTGGADMFDKFCPISLCNFSFKVITLILIAMIRRFLDRIISPFQSAFISGRWIAENTILARKVMHKMKKINGKGGLVGIKIDMSKGAMIVWIGSFSKNCMEQYQSWSGQKVNLTKSELIFSKNCSDAL